MAVKSGRKWQWSLKFAIIGLCFVALGGVFLGFKTEKVAAQEILASEQSNTLQIQSDLTDDDISPAFNKFINSIFSGMVLNIVDWTMGIEAVKMPGEQTYTFVLNQDKGVMPAVEVAFGAVTQLPVSGTSYIAQNLKGLGLNIAQPVQAQGYGYSALLPLQDVWRIFRNAAYVFFTLVILVVGFMILFQQKLDGQLVVSVQQALPRIVLAIVMVTFSYAIAGLLIDLMYLMMYLFGGLFQWKGAGVNTGMENLMGDSIWGLGWKMIWAAVMSIGDLFSSSNLVMQIIWIFLNVAAIGLPTLILSLIFFCAMLSALWKLFKSLLKSYVMILLQTIFAPIQLMLGAIDTKYITNWLRSMVSNLAAYVTVFVLMTIYYVFEAMLKGSDVIGMNAPGVVGTAQAANPLFSPPYVIGNLTNADKQAEMAFAVIGLGIMLMLPELVEKVKAAIGPKDTVGLGEMVKNSVALLTNNPVSKGLGTAASYGTGVAKEQIQSRAEGQVGAMLGSKGNLQLDEDGNIMRDEAGRTIVSGAFSGRQQRFADSARGQTVVAQVNSDAERKALESGLERNTQGFRDYVKNYRRENLAKAIKDASARQARVDYSATGISEQSKEWSSRRKNSKESRVLRMEWEKEVQNALNHLMLAQPDSKAYYFVDSWLRKYAPLRSDVDRVNPVTGALIPIGAADIQFDNEPLAESKIAIWRHDKKPSSEPRNLG